jgi:hypothetical protein
MEIACIAYDWESRRLAAAKQRGEPSKMTLRRRLICSTAIAGFAVLSVAPARAGLIDSGGTVQVFFTAYTQGAAQSPVVSPAAALTPTDPANQSDAQPLTMVQQFTEATSDTLLTVADTTLTIENQLNPTAPFCFSPSYTTGVCPDPSAIFDFKFTGVTITGVSVDPSTPNDFLPVGLPQVTTIGDTTDVTVNVVGDNPATGDSLILDLAFTAPPPPPPPTSTPEPASLALLGVAAGGMFATRRRRPRG